jgi:hypothetical protein
LVSVDGAEASSYDKYQDWVMTFQPVHHSSDWNSYKELRSFVKDRSETYISRAFGDDDNEELEEFVMEYERVDWEDLGDWFKDHGTPDEDDNEEEYHFMRAVKLASENSTLAIDGSNIVDGSVTDADLAVDSVGSAEIADGSIVDADVSGSAAIAASKVNFTNQNIDTGTGNLATNDLTANGSVAFTEHSGTFTVNSNTISMDTDTVTVDNDGPMNLGMGHGTVEINNNAGTGVEFWSNGTMIGHGDVDFSGATSFVIPASTATLTDGVSACTTQGQITTDPSNNAYVCLYDGASYVWEQINN